MNGTLRTVLSAVAALFILQTHAQANGAPKGCKPPINRQLRHDYVDREQRNILRIDGRADVYFAATKDEDINYLVTRTLTQKVDALQCAIEKDTITSHNTKVTYLSGLEKLLRNFGAAFRARRISGSSLPALIDMYESAIRKERDGESIEELVEKSSYEVGNILLSSGVFDDKTDQRAARYVLIRKYVNAHPDRIFHTLNDYPDIPFRDSLILVGAYKNPRLLYDFAAADNKLGYAIRAIDDTLVRTVSRMAKSGGSGQLYFPFLDNILKGKQTIEEIDAVKADDVKYYKMLVKTRIDYINRLINRQPVSDMKTLDYWLERKAQDYFIKTINTLHNEPDAVRFRILHALTAEELYYLAVYSESEIYTSSYTKGVYPLMMQKADNRGDSLLMRVSFDRFRKFIKVAAGYNTLNDFLKSFSDATQANALMTAFVNGLEKSSGLEEGVDVADSYASIVETNKQVATEMLQNVKNNYDRNLEQNNRRGAVIYNLLYKLFLSADSSRNIDLSREFGIPPVYNVSYHSLAIDSQRVVMQMFFYGDKDGKDDYREFLRQFANGNWKKLEEKQWVQFASTRGKPVSVYANKPFDEESGEDEKAQDALTAYLIEKGQSPTVVIHRGHSYYANSTIEHIQPTAKIVFLGSCGGYHLIHNVLEHAPDAHIIASKQIGRRVINQPFINLLNDKMRNGSDISWIPFWKEFARDAGRQEGFSDYIPPHKNLGAIFIKAYNSQMDVSGTEQ